MKANDRGYNEKFLYAVSTSIFVLAEAGGGQGDLVKNWQ